MRSTPELAAKPAHLLAEPVPSMSVAGPARSLTWVLALLLPVGILGFTFYDSITYMAELWLTDENYGHGMLVPWITLYLIWQRRHLLIARSTSGSWWGLAWILMGAALYVVGELATVYQLLHAALWCIIVGLLISALGIRAVSTIAFPLGFLLTVVPLPQFLYQTLSGKLQLISSALGVGCLQFIGITAFRDGNVIDLGPIQLQVVDACSGLRYLFPLATLALLCSYLFQERLWKRIVLFISSIPISILLNGFRIGMIGLLVEHFGQGAAEGFYHAFEGWVLFMASLALLLAEMFVLRQIGTTLVSRDKPFDTEIAPPSSRSSLATLLRPTYLYSVGLVCLLPFIATELTERGDVPPIRQPFLDFPMQFKEWSGTSFPLEGRYVEALKFDDYILADYQQSQSTAINLYIAYYRSQRKGQSAHSPQSCIPGGGWEIGTIETVPLGPTAGQATANRVSIQKGDQRQLVLYWFKQRDRIVANEYLVKLYVLWDAMTRQRTDGALIRLTTPIHKNESDGEAEQRLLHFAQDMNPMLTRYVPD